MDTCSNSNMRLCLRKDSLVTPPGKPPRSTEVIAEGEENLEWILEEVDDEYHLYPGNSSNNAPSSKFSLKARGRGNHGRGVPQTYME